MTDGNDSTSNRGFKIAVAFWPAAVALSATQAPGQAVWSELPALPQAIANNAVTSVDHGDGTSTIYSFMGIRTPTNPGTITPASNKLTLPGGDWLPIADAPLLNGKAKIGANAVTVAGKVYLIGGYTAGGAEVTEKRLFRYDPVADGYVQLADVPVEVDDTVTGAYQNRYIYLVSGWHGPFNNNVANVQIYDTQTDAWSQATPIPAPLPGLFGHAGTILGNRITYMDGVRSIGGFPISNRAFVGVIDPLAMGDLNTIAWTEVAPHPGSPTYRAAGSQGATSAGRMLLVGGTNNPYNFSGIGYNGQPSQPLDQVVDLDPVSGDWSAVETIGTHAATMDHRGLVQLGACWATVGGMSAPTVPTNRVFELSLVPGDFTCDAEVNLVDFAEFLACVTGPNAGPVSAGCEPGDRDDDGDVDFADFRAFQQTVKP